MGFFDRYPYTNWHNVNLDWVLECVKEWGQMVEANNQAFQDLEEANASFKEYVTNYLQNLDIQAQIDDKLDRMFESGELTEYLQPYVSNTVTDWLEENITEPVGVVIDSSLTVAGAAADAKAVGDRLSPVEVLSSANNVKLTRINNSLYELLETATGQETIILNGYNSGNNGDSIIANSPYVYNRFTPNESYSITGLKLNVSRSGVLSVGTVLKTDCIRGTQLDLSKFERKELLTISSVGVQEKTFSNPIIVDTDHYFFVCLPSDSVIFKYGNLGVDKGFLYTVASTNVITGSDNSLNIDLRGYITSVNYRSVINSVLINKKISILGDSISTFAGFIPSGSATYYPSGDVTSVSDTWWRKVIDALGLILDINNSWSGSYVTTNNGDESAGCMSRCENLGSPDIIIVYMGINDFNNEVVIGEYTGHSSVPVDTTTFANAYSVMLNKILTKYTTAKVYVCTLIDEERNLTEGFPEINGNGNSINDYNNTIKNLADIFNVEVLDIAKSGLTYQNMSVYNPNKLHPNKAGHSLIANYIINRLDNAVSKRY